MPRRSRLEIARAVRRIVLEELVPVADLVDLADAGEQSLIRWIVAGRQGRYLDGLKRDGVWMSSKEAVARFKSMKPVPNPVSTPRCGSCGTQCVVGMVGEPSRLVAICPKCPLPVALIDPLTAAQSAAS